MSFNGDIVTWKLYEKYDGWMTDGNQPILSSKTHTDKELVCFLKKVKKYGVIEYAKILCIIPFLSTILSFVNIFLHSTYLYGIVIGFCWATIIVVITELIVFKKNIKASRIEQKLKLDRVKRQFLERR